MTKEKFIIKSELTIDDKLVWQGELAEESLEKDKPSVERLVLETALNRICDQAKGSHWRDSWNKGPRHVRTWAKGG